MSERATDAELRELFELEEEEKLEDIAISDGVKMFIEVCGGEWWRYVNGGEWVLNRHAE